MFFAVFFTMVIVPVILYIEFVFTPILNGHLDFLDFINNDGVIERYGEHIKEQIINEQITIDEFSSSMLSMVILVLGPLFLILPVLFIIPYSIIIANWVCKKIHILPMLQLVVIRNGKGTTVIRFRQ